MTKKSIFITGAGQGIGAATARLFAQNGWFIGLSDINETSTRELAAELGQENCSVHTADVRDVDQLQKALEEFGRQTNQQMHVLFNNAGILFSGGFGPVPLEKQKAIVDVNFIGLMNVTHLALPMLKKTSGSCILNMSSASAYYGNPELTAYAATKSAVRSLTEGWNLLFKKQGIHVADIVPAYVRTAMVDQEQEAMKLKDSDIKITAKQVAAAVWKAAHSRKMRHYVGRDVRLLRAIQWLLPSGLFVGLLKATFYKEALLKN